MADETDFTINIDAPADNAEQAALAVDQLRSALEAAERTSLDAASALTAGEAAYKRVSGEADKAAKSLEGINVKLDEQRAAFERATNVGDFKAAERAARAVENLSVKQAAAEVKATQTKAALEAEAAALDKLRAKADGAASAEQKLTKQLDAAKAKTTALAKEAGSGKANEIAEGLAKLGGPLGSVGQKVFGAAEGFKKLSASLGSAGPYVAVAVGILAIVAGIAAVTAAAVSGVAAITAWSVQLSDAARTQKLLADGVAGSVSAGNDLDDAIKRMANKTVPQSRDGLLAMAADLKKAGFEGKALRDELEKTAIKAAVTKFGPEFQKQLNSLPQLAARLKGNISGLFGGLRIEKLLEGFSKLVALFDASSVSGRAIKVVFESLFQPLIDGVVAWIPKMVSAFIQFEIMVLKALIAIKPFGSTILEVGQWIGILALVIGGALALAIGVVVAGLAAMAVGFAAGVAIITGLIAGAIYLGSVFADLGAGAVKLGSDIISGLVDGIKGGAQAVISAITGVVDGAIGAAKSALVIASPSKVFAEIGTNTAAGMSEGVDDGASDVQGSMEALVAPPTAAPGAASAPTAQVGGNVGGAPIIMNFYGEQKASVVDEIRAFFESTGARAGAAVT